MFPYAARVAPPDRWAITAYIRALQASTMAKLADVPPDNRQTLAMNAERAWTRARPRRCWRRLFSAIGRLRDRRAVIDAPGFFRAWLCAYLFWLGLPLCGGDAGPGARSDRRRLDGDRAAGARRGDRDDAARDARRHPGLYRPGQPLQLDAPRTGPRQYLVPEPAAFYLRYAIYVVLWNLLAAFALLGPRGEAEPIAPALSWLSGVALILLALYGQLRLDRLDPVARADILVLDLSDDRRRRLVQHRPGIVVLTVVLGRPAGDKQREHIADLAADPARDGDLLGLCRIHAVPDHLGRESEERDPLVSAAHRAGSRRLFVAIAGILRAVPDSAVAPGKRSRACRGDAVLILFGHAAENGGW